VNIWRGFQVGRHVSIRDTAAKFNGRRGRIVDMRAVGPLHFIDVLVDGFKVYSTFRPGELTPLNPLEELARLDEDS
jgi:hypothetical protein